MSLAGHIIRPGRTTVRDAHTLTETAICYSEIPRFRPRCSPHQNPNPSNAKKYRAGIEQLLQEHIVQSFNLRHGPSGVTCSRVGRCSSKCAVRPSGGIRRESASKPPPAVPALARTASALEHPAASSRERRAWDGFRDRPASFSPTTTMRYFVEKNPDLQLHSLRRQ